MAYRRIGDLLVGMGSITQSQLEEALRIQKTSKQRMGEVLIQNGYVTEEQIMEALEIQLGIDSIDLSRAVIPLEMAQILPKNIARKNRVVPVKVDQGKL